MADTLDTLLNAAAVEEPSEIQTFDADVSFVSKLEDEPNDVGGMTSKELKEAFDQGGNTIKVYLNEVLIPALREYWKYDQRTRELMAKLSARFDQAVLGQIPDESIVTRMLAAEFYEHFHTREEAMSADTKAAYDLGADAVPDDALKLLSGFPHKLGDEYLWKRIKYNREMVFSEGTTTLTVIGKSAIWEKTVSVTLYNTIAILEDGTLELSDPVTYTGLGKNMTSVMAAANLSDCTKYYKDGNGVVYAGYPGEAYGRVNGSSNSHSVEILGFRPFSYFRTPHEDVRYLNSRRKDAFPKEDGEFTNLFLGHVGDKANIKFGTYVGTGVCGSLANANSLTFDFVPKLVFIRDTGRIAILMYPYNANNIMTLTSGNGAVSTTGVNCRWEKETVTWWETFNASSPMYQMNVSGTVYHYVAFG